MRRKQTAIRSLIVQSSLGLAMLLALSHVAKAQFPQSGSRQPVLAQAVTPQEQQLQAAELMYRRAVTLFIVLLGALVLLIGLGVASLWFLRRSVVQEVAAVVRVCPRHRRPDTCVWNAITQPGYINNQ